MVKHKRWSDKQKADSNKNNIQEIEDESASPKTEYSIKSIILSGTKYAYIIAAAALLSGIFTPITLGIDIFTVILGMLTLFLGLGGAVVILLSIKNQNTNSALFFGGIGMIFVSLIIIYEIAELSLFG